jgi:hypothetical protein
MKLVDLSMDELNQSLVRHWADRRGIRVECRVDLEWEKTDRRDAVLLDTDHLPSNWLEDFLMRRSGAGEDCPVAAHGYGTSGDELRDRGVLVHSRLRSGVLRELTQAAMSMNSDPEGSESDDLTWVNLVE